jgi:hypothetical protein
MLIKKTDKTGPRIIFGRFFSELQCVGHLFPFVDHFVIYRDVWIPIQRAA